MSELSIASGSLDCSAHRPNTNGQRENGGGGGGTRAVAREQPDLKVPLKEGADSRYVGTGAVAGGTLYLALQQMTIFLTLVEMPLYVNARPEWRSATVRFPHRIP